MTSLKREAIYFHYPHYHHSRPASAVRQGKFKLIQWLEDGQFEEAIAWQNQLIRDADLETQGLQVIRWRANLELYENGRSCCAKAPGTG